MLIALTALLIGGTFWARNKSRDEVCTEVRVEVVNDDGTSFVTPAGVIEELERKHIILKGKPVWQINVENVEKAIAQSQYIENVECMFVNGGCLKIKVSQIMPVMRIFDGDQSYYVNKDGKRMTAVATFNANVPVVEGHFTKAYSPLRLLPMIQYVESDSALKSLVTMYCVKDSNNIIIIPSVEGHVVNMGNCTGYESKFRKLKLFYNKVMPIKGWMYYDTISVKWDYQVVATRRDKVVEVVQQYDPEEDEIADNASTMKVTTNPQAPAKKPEENKPAATPSAKADKPQQEQKKEKNN